MSQRTFPTACTDPACKGTATLTGQDEHQYTGVCGACGMPHVIRKVPKPKGGKS